jgi:parvulin-like peptidyl-prolyl isomerase
VETYAAARHILLKGDDADTRRRARELRSELRAGADFAELAREHSEDPLTKERGGVIAIFERGSSDVLLKAAAFDSPIGEVVGPISTPIGLHLFERLAVEDVDPALADPTWVRGRAIVLAYDGARGVNQAVPRTQDEARRLGLDLVEQVRGGGDFAALARTINDDVGGRERAGDLGWLHRRGPKSSPVLDRLFTAEPGEVFDPVLSESGVIIVQRAPADE